MNIKLTVILLFTFLCFSSLAQNTRTVRGKITNKANGEALPGATVKVKNTFDGTVSNFDGNFQLLLSGSNIENIILEFSFIGMQVQDIKVGNKTVFNIELEESLNELKQFVVTSSYGTKKLKEEIVGSISTIGANDIDVEQASESIDKMLDGQIAGVLIEPSSTINGPVKIDIRGQGSLSQNTTLGTSTQPLIIIDGVIMGEESGIDNSLFDGAGTGAENFQNPLAQISPDDIETFTVLKDAAAVGIYGADGANGVILITTKKGKKGKLNIGFSTQFGLSQAINRIKYMNGEQFADLRNEYGTNSGQGTYEYNGINTDWYELLNQDGTFQRYNLSLNGGKKNITYRSSLNYINIGEAQKGNSSNQYRMSNNLGYAKNKLSIDLSFNPSFLVKDLPNIYYAFAFMPNIAPYNEDGSFSKIGVTGQANPLAAITQNLNNTKTFSVLSSLNLKYEIAPNWNASSTFGVDYKDKTQDRYFSGANESGQFNGTFKYEDIEYPKWGRRIINERNSLRWNWQSQTNYKKQLGAFHTLEGMAGMELAKEQTDLHYAGATGFTDPTKINPVEAALKDDDPLTLKDETYSNQTISSDINYNSRVSAYGQLNYDYKKKYFLLINLRRDQSSVFGNDVDVAYNSGAGISWIVSKENFFSELKGIDFLSLRLSYGKTGNSRIGSYRAAGIYATDKVNGYGGYMHAYPQNAANGALTWESNIKFNAGVEINFLKRFKLVVDYFYDDIRDMITSRYIPTEIGFGQAQINGADMYNKGLEIALNTEIIKSRAVKWNLNLNFSSLQNKITNIVGLGDQFSGSEKALALKVGSSTSAIWGTKWEGVDPATGRALVRKGNEIYDYITYKDLFDSKDWEIIGNSMPDFYGGFRNNFSYKNRLSLSISGRYKYGLDKKVDDELISKYNITTNRNLSVNAIDHWKNPGDIALLPAVSKTTILISNSSNLIYDASHLKISNINLSYRIPMGRFQKYVKHLAVFADVSNVFYVYLKESPKDRNGIREFSNIYPEARTWTTGLKANF